jgi:integron integrase
MFDQPFEQVDAVRAKKPVRMPPVFSREEAIAVISQLDNDTFQTMAKLLYGSGLRIMECARLRIKDVDFQRKQILVRNGKGQKDRYTILMNNVIVPLQRQICYALSVYEQDYAQGYHQVYLPYALERKYPQAASDRRWYWVFPSRNLSVDPRSGRKQRHHIHPTSLQKAVNKAIRKVGIMKQASCHTFRHSFATHLLESGKFQLHEVQELLGHKDINVTQIYLHILRKKENPLNW